MKHTLLRHEALRSALMSQCQLSDTHPVQLQIPVQDMDDLVVWLEAQTQRPRLFWTDRRRTHRVAACGVVQRWESLEQVQTALKTLPAAFRVYGGWAFNPEAQKQHLDKHAAHTAASTTAIPNANPWQNWPGHYFFLPRWELRQDKHGETLCLNLWGNLDRSKEIDLALEILQTPAPTGSTPPQTPLPLETLHDTPDLAGWQDMLKQARTHFDDNTLQKIVLSKVSCSKVPQLPLCFMKRLLERQRQAYHFWFEPFENNVLWGASPERLYTRQGRIVKTEALAGTRPRPANTDAALAYRDELLHSPKEQQENERVQEHIEHRLGPLSSSFWMEPLTVIQAGPVQHLYRQIKAEVHPEIQDAELVRTLHPTPAVSGYPSAAAITALESIEPHARGWYTGALGWISAEAAEWTVVLRVALWQEQCMYFYTGAGIMPDSDPVAEWKELEVKLLSLKTLFD